MKYKIVFYLLTPFLLLLFHNNINGQNSNQQQDQSLEKKEKIINYYVIKDKPEFPGGQVAMFKFIAEHTRYPEIAKKKGITGKVFVKFIIDKDGSVTNVELVRGVNPVLDAEAIRVIKSMPEWKPGYIDGVHPVKVLYTVPINFILY